MPVAKIEILEDTWSRPPGRQRRLSSQACLEALKGKTSIFRENPILSISVNGQWPSAIFPDPRNPQITKRRWYE
jgi:hypothetical protein